MSFWTTLLPFGFLKTSATDREAALASPSIENLGELDRAKLLVAGGKQTATALPVKAPGYSGALFSSKGRGYARYNEDAAGLFFDKQGRVYAMAFDQAGGLGGRVRGHASALAAKAIVRTCQTYAGSDGHNGDPVDALLDAFIWAHKELVGRREGEVTTAIVGVIEARTAYLVNSGDSGAVLYDAQGRIKSRTVMDEFPPPNDSCLKHALGLEPEGCEPVSYTWALEEGDWLLFGSDGLLDSGMVEDKIGEMLAELNQAELAVNRICTLILRRMGTLRAKPDNLTVVLVRVEKSTEVLL